MQTPLKDVVYRALRDYQDGNFAPSRGVWTQVGLLDEALTQVYDRIVRAIDQESASTVPDGTGYSSEEDLVNQKDFKWQKGKP